ncbi:MAG: magnesium and cobalt exporter, family [Gaiellales bacterium]|jgi:CBS domain containing-hemolysin-like protein|nr:magnesium and cobalt exporter, family [Gaiellales bacterium]
MSLVTAVELLLIIVCVLWNAFFVAAEYAFVSVRHTRLDELVSQGSRRARLVRKIVSDPSHFISAMQLGITLSSLALGALGEPAVARVIESVVGGVSGGVATAVSVIVAFLVISILHVVIGEIVPKSYTLPRAERVALAVAVPIRAFFVTFGWFITFLDWLAQIVMRLLGITPTDELEGSHSEVELRMLLRQGERAGVLEPDEQQMIDKVFDFSDTPVEHVMVPRPDIVALPVALTPKAAMEQVLRHPYTRYPVYEDEFDNVLGVLHVRRLFVALQNGAAASTDLRALLYPPHLVPETKRLGQLLAEIRRQKGHMAIVIDEYGSVAGLVTLEDLLEEIVGEIDDEFDPEDAPILRLGPDRYRVEGSFPVEEFNERFGRDLSDDDYHTVGGIVFGELGRAPAVGDSVEVGNVKFDVAAVDGTRILHADATLLPVPETPDEDEDGQDS